MKSLIMVIILVISVLVLSCGDYSRPKAPDFSITDIQGKTYTLAGLENKGVIFLHFWSLGTPQNNQDMIDIGRWFPAMGANRFIPQHRCG